MCFIGLNWVFTVFHSNEPGFTVFYWVLLSLTRLFCVLLGYTGFYCDLLGFTFFYWVLLGYTVLNRDLLGFTRFFSVSTEFLPSFTGIDSSTLFCWLILGFTLYRVFYRVSIVSISERSPQVWWTDVYRVFFYRVFFFFFNLHRVTKPASGPTQHVDDVTGCLPSFFFLGLPSCCSPLRPGAFDRFRLIDSLVTVLWFFTEFRLFLFRGVCWSRRPPK